MSRPSTIVIAAALALLLMVVAAISLSGDGGRVRPIGGERSGVNERSPGPGSRPDRDRTVTGPTASRDRHIPTKPDANPSDDPATNPEPDPGQPDSAQQD